MITHLPMLEEIFFIQTGQQRPEGINDVTFVKTKDVSVAYGTGERGLWAPHLAAKGQYTTLNKTHVTLLKWKLPFGECNLEIFRSSYPYQVTSYTPSPFLGQHSLYAHVYHVSCFAYCQQIFMKYTV